MHRRSFLTQAGLATLGAGFGLRVVPALAQDGAPALAVAHRFPVGSATVTALSDGFLPITPDVLVGISPEEFAARLAEAYVAGPGHPTGVNAFVIDNGTRTLIDTGTGPAMGPGLGQLTSVMAAVGIAPESIDAVIATHLHPDHIGGALVTSFPNATLHVAQAELDFWSNADYRAQSPAEFQGFFDMAQGGVAAFGERLSMIAGADDLGNGLTAMPLPGHTFGHTGVMLESDGQTCLFWGDIIHVGAVQFAQPEVTIAFDTDQDMARATRMSTLDMAATDRLMIAGAHLSFPGVGFVERAGDAYRWQPAPYPYG